jgi:hypothetical protein
VIDSKQKQLEKELTAANDLLDQFKKIQNREILAD